MGNKSAPNVQYSDCKHFSLVSKRCISCHQTACFNCYGFPLAFNIASLDQVQFTQVCQRCYIKGTRIKIGEWWEVTGEGNQKEILFLHGEGYTRKMFRHHALDLAQKGYRCILIDLPGHGALVTMEFTLKNCIRTIEKALTQHCLKSPVSAVGFSFGGLALIEYLGSHQSAFKKLILLSCCFELNRILDALSRFYSRVEEAREVVLNANSDNLKADVFLGALQGGLCPLRYRQRKQFMQAINPLSWFKKNKGYVPILLINGESQDRYNQSEYFQFAGKNSFLLVYPNNDDYFWCEQSRYFSLLNDITYFFNRE